MSVQCWLDLADLPYYLSKLRAKEHEQRFLRAMKEFRSRSDEPALATFDIRDRRSNWYSVLTTAAAAQQQYDQKRKGFRGIFHHTSTAIGEASPHIEPFLDLLPCGDYTSVVCGRYVTRRTVFAQHRSIGTTSTDTRSVKLIFAAFQRKTEAEALVRDTLSDAPNHLEQAETFLALYTRDKELERLVDELYVALLDAIEAVIAYLTKTCKYMSESHLAGTH